MVLAWRGTDAELLELLKRRDVTGAAALFDRFQAQVNRLVWRVMGADSEHDDLVSHVFAIALAGVHRVRDASTLEGWMVCLTVNTVRSELRKRRFRRWFRFETDQQADEPAYSVDHDAREALRRTYTLLDRLPASERIAFVLRFIEGLALGDVAASCGCSLATIKRRLSSAENAFTRLAAQDPVLAERLTAGGRWEPS